jgi:glycosyltransferase involved in cell wall biosynthesis
LRAYGLDSEVHYTGIDLARWTDRGIPRSPIILGVGSFASHKNIPFVIESIAMLPPSSRVPLVWVGTGESKRWTDDLQALARRLNVDLQIHPNISDESLIEWYNRASLLVYAPVLEPFGLGPLEANACGLPVVATAEGGMRETVKDGINGLLVTPTRRALAEGIQRILANPDLAKQLSISGKKHVADHWDLKTSILRIESWLQRVAAGEYGGI